MVLDRFLSEWTVHWERAKESDTTYYSPVANDNLDIGTKATVGRKNLYR